MVKTSPQVGQGKPNGRKENESIKKVIHAKMTCIGDICHRSIEKVVLNKNQNESICSKTKRVKIITVSK